MHIVLFAILIVLIVYYYRYIIKDRVEGFVNDYYSLNWTDPTLIDRVNEEKTLAYVFNTKQNKCKTDKLDKTNNKGKCDKSYLSYSMSCDYTDNAHPHCVANHDLTFGPNMSTSSI